MALAGLLDVVLADPALRAAAQTARDGSPGARDLTAPAPLRPFAVAALAAAVDAGGAGKPVLAVTASSREADDLADALGGLIDPATIAVFPSWETLPHERLSPRADTVGARLAVLRRLAHPEPHDPDAGPIQVVVASVRSLLQPQVAGLGDVEPLRLQTGVDSDLDQVIERLVELAYTRVEIVERRGEFAVRGGIIDIFPPTTEHPLRVEFFGDTVEEIRAFTVADQRSMTPGPDAAPITAVWAPPCRELPLTPAVRDRARALAAAHPEVAEICDKLAEGMAVEGMEALAPVLADRMNLLVEELPADTQVMVCDPERIRRRAADLVSTSEEFLAASWTGAAEGGAAPIDLEGAAYRSIEEVRRVAEKHDHPWWTVSQLGGDLGDSDPAESGSRVVDAQVLPPYGTEIDRAVSDVQQWSRDGARVVLVFAGHGTAERAVEVLGDAGVGAAVVTDIDQAPFSRSVTVATGCLPGGFTLPRQGLVLLTGTELGGRENTGRSAPRMPSRRRQAVDLVQLQAGDYVVHSQHGVGKYVEMIRRTINGGDREYLILEYAPGKKNQPPDRLFVPTDQLELLTRYVGGEAPTVDRLGGSDWAKRKGRARKAVRQIAAELIRLYSARVANPGHAFGPDTPWQRELEDAFPYTETPDQMAAIDEVKADMAREIPMDRVICGDVGYGKTEIAVRAAFKAAQDGKQVAVLVPTTLLAQQHYNTFSERMAQFPVTVRVLSRFNSAKEQREVIDGLGEGTVDIVIGTHRLLQSSVKFKDLGLVIVDEEQRFGVEHKEHLKSLRTAVDVLTMSATPIPRTLEMSMTGIREMSTILTPPEERHPVLTYVGAYDDKQVGAAIRRELLRDGQVFYLHNRVESIERTAKKLRELVPEARVGIGHGQMTEDELERVMLGFWNRDYDVLVCTTIVESGLDIPNANTLLVERADLFGLSQLHQIRGRVGRSRERAYAYFLYPPERPMTETAHDRLATIAQNTDLGAGMAVAMKDLEIRGAGNLLGGEQSGHIAGVGFDLYVRMVGEAVAEFKNGGQPVTEEAEVKVDLPVDAHLPHDYIPGERLRLEMYRKLAEVSDDAALEAIRDELLDRYGLLPEPVTNLLAVAAFRIRARAAGLTEVSTQGNTIRFSPVSLAESKVMRVQRLYPKSLYKQTVGTLAVPKPMTAAVAGKPVRDTALLDWCADVLDAVAG